MRKLLPILLIALVLALTPAALAVTPGDYIDSLPENLQPGHLYGESCILINADTGYVLLEKDADAQRYPASTTKIMTCILALESGLAGTEVTIPASIGVPSDSSKMGLTPGDKMDFTDLVYGMMLSSGNDAAVAIATLVSGSEDAFVREMNLKAQALGMTGTHYVNSHGYHKVNHYTTARDLATLTRYAMNNELFRSVVSATEYTVFSTYHPNGWTFTTKYDPLLPGKALYYEPCIGVKTGSTKAAGRCFVGAAKQGNITLISVTLGTDPTDTQYSKAFLDTIHMAKFGFTQYASLSFKELYALCGDDLMKSITVEKASRSDPGSGVLHMNELNVADIPVQYQEWYLKKDIESEEFKSDLAESFASRLTFEFESAPTAPIHAGDVLGNVYYNAPSGEVLTGTLVAARDVEMEPPTVDEIMDEWIENNAPWLFKLMPRRNPPIRLLYWLIFAGIAALIILRVRRTRQKNRARKRMMQKNRRELLRRQQQREAYLRAHPELRKKQAAKGKTVQKKK